MYSAVSLLSDVDPSFAARERKQDRNIRVAFLGSAALHIGAAILLLAFGTGKNVRDSSWRSVPVELVEQNEQSLNAPGTSQAARHSAAHPSTTVQGVAPTGLPAPVSELEAKLVRLSKLQRSDDDITRDGEYSGGMGAGAAGAETAYRLRDYIRAQVERRWTPDLQRLAYRDVAVPIRIEMTDHGVVTKAEIVETARAASDEDYRNLAISARNAVLLSSPFALPRGPSQSSLEMTLVLRPSDALR